jgi:Zn-dependent protease with chaperone function
LSAANASIGSTPVGDPVAVRYYAATGAARAVDAELRAGASRGELILSFANQHAPVQLWVRDIVASERFSRATRTVQLPDGALLEVDEGAALSRLLTAAGRPDAMVTRWQHSWRMVVASLVLSVAAIAAAYVWVLPVTADFAAQRVPASWTEALDNIVLGQLKLQESLKPSELPIERQQQLRSKFEAIAASASASPTKPQTRIHFYRIGGMANAFALPGGSIVFLDGIVKVAPDDDALAGVFAHEFGHVAHRHGLRTLLRTAVVSAVAAWYFGDLTSLASAAVLVSQLSYSREFEADADDTAIALMRANGLNTRSLAELFRRMRDRSDRAGIFGDDDAKPDENGKEVAGKVSQGDTDSKARREKFGGVSIPEFLSTHPDIDRRIERFEKASKAQSL